jgi:hypothetical protein
MPTAPARTGMGDGTTCGWLGRVMPSRSHERHTTRAALARSVPRATGSRHMAHPHLSTAPSRYPQEHPRLSTPESPVWAQVSSCNSTEVTEYSRPCDEQALAHLLSQRGPVGTAVRARQRGTGRGIDAALTALVCGAKDPLTGARLLTGGTGAAAAPVLAPGQQRPLRQATHERLWRSTKHSWPRPASAPRPRRPRKPPR